MILIKNIEIYSPEYMGKKDVLISGGKISLIEDNISIFSDKIEIIDGSGKMLIPGFIDNHVHITGGGGEGSFKTRAPELPVSKLVEAGITTVVGLLGTDSSTRSVENLVAKAKALKEEGITAYALTGAYSYPSPTITGSVKKDIVFIDEIIGCKIALSDHRSSSLTNDELARLASDVRVAGMLSGKAGVLVAHMGDGEKALCQIREVLKNTEIPVTVIRPTHVSRNEWLLREALEYAKIGGIIDITCGEKGELSTGNIILKAEKLGVPLENITLSSDGYGSWSNYDEKGNMIEIGISPITTLYEDFKTMVLDLEFTMDKALQFFTTNVAKALKIYPKKGTVREGSDADVLILDKDLNIELVLANGKMPKQTFRY